jgi:hypothetical protein
MNKDTRRFYVYLWLRHKDSKNGPRLSPYYVGKGSGNRAFNPRQRRVKLPKDRSYIVFVQEGLTEQEAFDLERYCIALYGRKDLGTGILGNFTDGGEGVSGFKFPQEIRDRISRANLGRVVSQETRDKLSRANKGNQNFLGKTHTPETKAKMSLAQMGNQNFLGKTHTQEVRNRISRGRLRHLYELTDPNGEIYVTENLTDFAKQYGLSQGNLANVIHGKRKTHKGWTGRIVETFR